MWLLAEMEFSSLHNRIYGKTLDISVEYKESTGEYMKHTRTHSRTHAEGNCAFMNSQVFARFLFYNSFSPNQNNHESDARKQCSHTDTKKNPLLEKCWEQY